jgi:hypothetical protein
MAITAENGTGKTKWEVDYPKVSRINLLKNKL